MNIEIEAKMPLRNPEELANRLVTLGALRGPVLLEVNTYFDTPQFTLKAGDQGLRLRVENEMSSPRQTITITHKGPRAHGKLKSRWETEVIVADAKAAAQLLTALGYQGVFTFEKVRQLWDLDGCHIAIDRLPYLGHYVEIEGPTDQAVLTMRDKLELDGVPLIQASYISMLSIYLSEHHISSRHIAFENETGVK